MTSPADRSSPNPALRTLLERAIRRQDTKTAEGIAARAEAHFRLAVLPGGDVAEAVRHLRAAIALDSVHPKYHFHLGRVLHNSGDSRGAVCAYRQALRLGPSSHRTWTHLGLALTDLREPHKKLGQDLLDALFKGLVVRDFLPAVDELIRGWMEPSGKPPFGRKAVDPKAEKEDCRYEPIGRMFLMEHLSRPKIQRRSVEKCLDALQRADTAADYALACLQLMIAGDPPADVSKMVLAAKVELPDEAVRLVLAATGLARETDPKTFVAEAERAITNGLLPVDLIVWLHYSQFGPDSQMKAIEAVRTLDLYSRKLLREPAFVELRIAVLDGFARRAWGEQDFARCRVLWREAMVLDPTRVETAHNLALVASRTNSHEDYTTAWMRAAEVRYLRAAASGDVLFGIEDRRLMHLTVLRQAESRYLPKANDEKEERVTRFNALVRDEQSLQLILREFDLYYLNSRLGFQSPVHLLGIARDASSEKTEAARVGLNAYFDRAFESAKLAGGRAFAALVNVAVNEAYERASRNAERARDPYYESEKPEADRFADETLVEAVQFIRILEVVCEKDDLHPLASRIFQTLSGLPWMTLHDVATRTGMIEPGTLLCDVVASRYLGVLRMDRKWIPKDEADVKAKLAEAQRDLAMVYPGTWPDRFRDAFESLAGVAAMNTLNQKGLRSLEDVEKLQAGLEKILKFVPRAYEVRIVLADMMINTKSLKLVESAISLLKAGVELKHEKETDFKLRELLTEAEEAVPGARCAKKVMELLEPASKSMGEALKKLQDSPSPESLRAAAAAAAKAVRDGERALEIARRTGTPDLLEQATEALESFRSYQGQLKPLLKTLKEE